MTYKTICRCDHDMATHYKETFGAQDGRRTSCLARGCECRLYRDSLEVEKPSPILKPEPIVNGFYDVRGATTGRTDSSKPNLSNPPRTDPPSAPGTLPPITWPNWP